MALNETSKKKRELFFNNLLLLGFDPQSMEKQYRIQFHKDMFSKTNKKGFEVVTYFLFSKLSELTKEDYSFVWPLLGREMDRKFQKIAFSYLTSIAQNSDIRFPVVLQSVLTSYCGNRFYDLYFAFSSHVMKQAVLASGVFKKAGGFSAHGEETLAKKLLLNRPTLKSETFPKYAFETLQLHSSNYFEEFKNIQKDHCQAFVSWQKQARELVNVIRNLKASLSSNRTFLDEQTKSLSSLLHKNISETNNMKEIVSELLEYKNKVECDWKVLEDFILKEKEMWNKIASELDESEKPKLDGLEIDIHLPNCILEEMSDSDKEIYSSVKKSGKVSIIRSVQTFLILLKYFSRIVKEGDFSKVKGVASNDVNVIEDCMTDLKSLNAKLCSEVLPNTIRHVEKLQEALDAANASEELSNFSQDFLSQAKVSNSECINKKSVLDTTERLIKAPERELNACNVPLNESVDENEFRSRLLDSKEPFSSKRGFRPQITSSTSSIESANSNIVKDMAGTSVFSPTSRAPPHIQIHEVSSSSEKAECSLNLDVPFSPVLSVRRISDLAAEGYKRNESSLSEDLNLVTLPNVSLLD